MPIKKYDPFADPLVGLSADVNAYVQLIREPGLPLLYGPELAPCPGRWRERFAESMQSLPEALILEIGSHLGEVILQMAGNHPKKAFIGIDITFKRVVKVAQKSLQANLKNLYSVLANAKGLDVLFAPHELDGVVVFFPDPWIKKQRQAKNRLLQAPFFEVLATKLKPGASLWFKTDCEPYFKDVQAILTAQGWRFPREAEGLSGETYTSRFERHFKDRGFSTFELRAVPPLA